MSAHNEQNGRHPILPVHSAGPSDPRIRNLSSTDQQKVCRDYVWGICNKYGQCRFRHECSLDEMKSIIRFCHDHQNRTGCLRPDCSYLHTSSEEQNLFLSTGQLPAVLLERHAAMNAAAAAAATNGSLNTPPLFVAHPPPPPPPPLAVSAPAPAPPPPPPPLACPAPVMPPPPPPPPPEPSGLTTVPPAALYTAPPPQAPQSFHINQPPPALPAIFDASRPPPPIPAGIRSETVKRPAAEACEAGPSKKSKAEDNKVAENLCEMCIQREFSIKLCVEELENLRTQREYKKLLFKTKADECENLKAMMRLFLPAEICLAVEEYIDGVHNPPISLSLRQLASRLFEDRTDFSSTNMMDSMQSSSMRELFIGYLLNSSSSTERSSSIDLRPSEILSADVIRSSTSNQTITSNGFSRLVGAQRAAVTAAAPPVSVVPTVPVVAPVPAPAVTRPVYVNTPSTPRAYPSVAPPGPRPYPPPFQPAVPPPTAPRPAYPPFTHPAPAPQVPPSAPFPSVTRATVPPQPAVATPTPVTAAPVTSATPNGLNYGQFMMTGYPSPHCYPPFQ